LTVLTTGTFGNPDLRPERVLGSEGGFEAALFRERIGIDLTYFRDNLARRDSVQGPSRRPSGSARARS